MLWRSSCSVSPCSRESLGAFFSARVRLPVLRYGDADGRCHPPPGRIDQLVEIIKVLGTPSREQIKTMNPNYMEHKFPQIKVRVPVLHGLG